MSANRGHYKTALLSGLSVAVLCAVSIKISKAIHWRALRQSVESPAVENSTLWLMSSLALLIGCIIGIAHLF